MVCFVSLITSPGITAAQILSRLPKLEMLRRDTYPVSFDELSAVSKNLISLICHKGFDIDTSIVDQSALIFSRLEEVVVTSWNCSDFQFIATVLDNSIPPQGRTCLKKLVFRLFRPVRPTATSVDYTQLNSSLIKVIEVRILPFNEEGIA
jgi:hypothetical protein